MRQILPLFAALLILLSGCATPLQVDYTPSLVKKGGARRRTLGPVLVKALRDSRGGERPDPSVIGVIDVTTQDIYGRRLVLAVPPAEFVSAALRRYLAEEGFSVVEGRGEKAPFHGLVVEGEVRKFRVDIGPREEIDLGLYLLFRDGKTGRVVWSGVAEEEESRFTGVFGPSRASISKDISTALTKVFRKALYEAGIGAGGSSTREGVEGSLPQVVAERGGLIIETTPSRVKVYINGVYYGLSPLRLRLKPGVYGLELRKEGYIALVEKVAVDPGRDTEVEEMLRKKK